MRESYCVYFHINPIKQEVFYVGIGNSKRPYKKQGRSKLWVNTVNKYSHDIIIIHKNLSWSEASQLEIQYIKQIGRKDLGKGSLVNLSSGGEGAIGVKRSDEQKQKIRLKLTGYKHSKEACENMGKSRLGKLRPHKEETKRKIGLAHVGKKLTQEHKDNIRTARTGWVYSEESKQKISQSKMGHTTSFEAKAKMRAAKLGIKNGPHSEETKRKMSLAKIEGYKRRKLLKELTEQKVTFA